MRKLLLLLLWLPFFSVGQSKKELKKIVVQYNDTIVDLEEVIESYKAKEIISTKEIREVTNEIENLEKQQDEILKKLKQQEAENTDLLNQKTTLKSSNTTLTLDIAVLNTKNDSLKSVLNNHSCVTATSNNVANTSTQHFLTNVYLGNEEIQNQEFTLNLEGVIYQNKRQTTHNYDDYNTKTFTYYDTEYLMKNEINCVLQPILDKSLGTAVSESEFNNSIYLYNNQFANDRVDVNTLFPSFSFTKGKLLTINGKDYLFSISYDSIYTSGTLGMRFNLTDDNEHGYDIPCVLNNGRIYLRMNNEIMSLLDFPILLKDELNFKIQIYNYFRNNTWNDASRYSLQNDYEGFKSYYGDRNLKMRCINETEYLTIFKKQTKFMSNDLLLNIEGKDNYNYDNSSLYLLFELIEK